jgi:hypothetical protein
VSNKFYFTLGTTGKTINIPLEMKWDFDGKEDSIEIYEGDVIEEIIGEPKDFEVLRFAHSEYISKNPPGIKTEIDYEFYLFTGNPSVVSSTTNPSLWTNSYLPGFTSTEVYYFSKGFINSFFKLDFYDTNNPLTQTNYFTIIIPTQQGLTETVSISPRRPLTQIKKPKFILDYLGDKEGFFFYWLRGRNFLDITTFYMSAKFFDAKNGVFIKMINEVQAGLTSSRYNFNNPADYFYYRVELDYAEKTYKVFKDTSRVGVDNQPIKWYEYVNP